MIYSKMSKFVLVLFFREEELMYLEFIADITNELILRGIYSDRLVIVGFFLFCFFNKSFGCK